MSQDYFQGGNSKPHPKPSSPSSSSSPTTPSRAQPAQWKRPSYMTVGAGSRSEHADRLTEMLDDDSGYGTLTNPSSVNDQPWAPPITADRPTPMFSPSNNPASPLSPHSDMERRAVASHRHQLLYNQNRTALARAITRTLDALHRLQDKNKEWPAHYPSVQAPVAQNSQTDPRPGLHHTQSAVGNDVTKKRPEPIRRADTTIGESAASAPTSTAAAQAESSAVAAQRPASEPRLVTPQLARDFSVLKIDLKMDGLAQSEIIHSLRKDSKALAQLLDGQITKSMRHLSALRERIEDTSSKVLVTGDLNAGKSTFCNALLRRKILPEDEQPCTSIFCEVLDVRDNGGIEEVHAIPIGSTYDRNDERTYDVFPLSKLEQIVIDNDHYSLCKVYVKDARSVDESLLNNGVLDIALIDAPGLNNDSLKTTAVFARQEEIDVVVFVVSAANHFTLSAREFIYDAAREKAYIFMVVNGFDNIRNKERCQEQILKQVAHLSYNTFKESSELVHFVSSNAIPVATNGPGGNGSGASGVGSSSSKGPNDDPNPDEGDDDDDNDGNNKDNNMSNDPSDKGKGKAKETEREQREDFDHLESSLRRFVLEKRARSKLAPAKTYLMNVLDDVNNLATVNRDVAQAELDRVSQELDELAPLLQQSQKSRTEAGDELDQSTEDVAADVYSNTRESLTTSISTVAKRNFGIEYPGFWDAYTYAEDLTAAMIQEISETLNSCEDYARNKTSEGVNAIKSLGLLHLGDSYTALNFQPDRMLRRRKDMSARQVDIDIDVWDFFEIPNLNFWENQENKVSTTSMAVTVAGALGTSVVGGIGWVDGAVSAARILGVSNIRRLLIPGICITALGAVAYTIYTIPTSLPRRLSAKLSTQLTAIDYVHANALRISSEVRKALKIPADNLRIGLTRNLEALQRREEETRSVRIESEVARKWFGNLCRESAEIRGNVMGVDLEGPPGLDVQ